MTTCHAFFDTMLFEQYKLPDQVNWPKLLSASAVVVEVAPVVVSNLNRHKDNPGEQRRLRKRAGEALRKLSGWLETEPPPELRAGVTIQYAHEATIDYASHQLVRDLEDNRLIATIIQFHEDYPDERVVLVTADMGLRLEARRHGIKTFAPPENAKLPPEEDEVERQNRELRAEVQAFQNRVPKPMLYFPSNQSNCLHTRLTLKLPIDALSPRKQAEIEELRSKHNSLPLSDSMYGMRVMQIDVLGITDRQRQRYNEAVKRYHAALETYQEQLLVYANEIRRTLRLRLVVTNHGNVPADELTITLDLPSDCIAGDKRPLTARPELPGQPKHPSAMLLGDINSYIPPPIWDIVRVAPPPDVNGPTVSKQAGQYVGVYTVRRLLHGIPLTLDPLYVVFPSFEKTHSFSLDVTIRGANLPKPVTQILNVQVDRPQEADPQD